MNDKTPEQKADEYVESKLKGFGGRCIEREYYENGLTLGYEAGYKAAKEEDNKKLSYAMFRANEWERIANEWEAAHDILKNTYEPGVLEYSEATPPTKEDK